MLKNLLRLFLVFITILIANIFIDNWAIIMSFIGSIV